MGSEIIQISLHNVLNLVKRKHHGSLKIGSSAFKAKGNLLVRKGSRRKNTSRLVLVLWENLYLVITRKNIHKRENLTSHALVKDLIDEWHREVFLRTSFIQIMEIYAYTNPTLFLVDQNRVRLLFCQRYSVDKAGFEKLLHINFDWCRFPWVNRLELILNKLDVFVCSNLMLENPRIYVRNFLLQLGKNIMKFFDKHRILTNFILRTVCSDKYIFNNIKHSINVDRDNFQYIHHIPFNIDVVLC